MSEVEGAEARRRTTGIARLYGAPAVERLARSHAVVVGIGGVGSWAAEALARSGVGRLTLIDLDHVAESNINRQVHALEATLGQAKVLAMRERIAQIDPRTQVTALDDFVTEANAAALLPPDADLLLDCCDQAPAKAAMAAWALARGIACLMSGAAGGKRDPLQVRSADLAAVTHDRLLAAVRQRLRSRHGAPRQGPLGVVCVHSREPIARADAMDQPACDPRAGLACAGYGSAVTVTCAFGMALAAAALGRLAATRAP